MSTRSVLGFGDFKGYNIVLICVDALRVDSLNRLIQLGFLRTIRTLYEKGYVFEKAYSHANMTDPSITTILTGLHPLSHGIIHHGDRVTPYELRSSLLRRYSLPLILAKNGYHTIAIDFLERWHKRSFHYYASTHGRKPSFVSMYRYFIKDYPWRFLRWYTLSLMPWTRRFITHPSLWHNGVYLVSIALKVLRDVVKKGGRFFLFTHFWSTHSPYYAPSYLVRIIPRKIFKFHNNRDERLEAILNEIKGVWKIYLDKWFRGMGLKLLSDVIRYYYASIMYVDGAIKRLIEFLHSINADDTLIIFTSDHGESLGEHGIYFDHHGLYEVSLRVPLVFYTLNDTLKHVRNDRDAVAHVDIVPTILELLGIKVDARFDGYNLFNEGGCEREMVAIETYAEEKIAFLNHNLKLIAALSRRGTLCRYCGVIHGGAIELYDLKRDPQEHYNLAESHSDIVRSLLKLYKRYILKFRILKLRYTLKRF